MSYAVPAGFDAPRTATGSSATGSYQNIGSITTYNAQVIYILSDCDKAILLSRDGTTDWIRVPAGLVILPIELFNSGINLKAGVQFAYKHDGAAPTAGKISITVGYAT